MKLDPRRWSPIAWLNVGCLAVGLLAIVFLDGLAFWLAFLTLLIIKTVVQQRVTRSA